MQTDIAGWLAERQSWHIPTFLFGLGLLFARTIMFALGSHPYLLAVARSLQCASAGTVFTVALSLLVAGTDRDEVGGWIGPVFPGMTAGLTFAPMVGGIIYARAGYFAVFAVTLVAIAVPFVLCLRYVDPKRGQQSKKAETARHDYGTLSQGQPRGQVSSDSSPDNRMRGCEDEESQIINKASRASLQNLPIGSVHSWTDTFPLRPNYY